MAETLYIRLGSQADDVIPWLIYSSSSDEIIASGEIASASELTLLTEKAQQRPVTVFVPSCDVALKQIKVPGKSSRAMRSAVPYMLEEELAQDVEQLFFAYADIEKQEADDEANCFVAIVDRALLKSWQQWLADADIFCKKMVPEVLALPVSSKTASVIGLNDQLLIRQGVWQGLTVDSSTWSVMCHQLFDQANDLANDQTNNEEDQADKVLIQAYSPLPYSEQQLSVEMMPEELPMALLAQEVNKQPFNLLQGEFQFKEKHSPVKTAWLWAAGIAVFALLLNVGVKTTQLLNLYAQQEAIEQEIIKSYRSTFPATKNVRISTVKSQLKRQLAQAGGGDSQTGFLAMLTKVRPAFSTVPEMKPESLKFDSKRQEIRIQAVSSDYQYFEKFKNAIEQTRLEVTQGAQSNQGEQVSGSFSITDDNGGKS